MVEKASGQPFGRFLEERILEPLGMTHSAFEPGSDWKGPRSDTRRSRWGRGARGAGVRGWLDAAGGLWASGPDLARWDLALMEGRVLKPGVAPCHGLAEVARQTESPPTTAAACVSSTSRAKRS